jgi:hypothetical protein
MMQMARKQRVVVANEVFMLAVEFGKEKGIREVEFVTVFCFRLFQQGGPGSRSLFGLRRSNTQRIARES